MPEQEKKAAAVSFDEFPKADYAAWKAAAEKTLKGANFEKKLTTKTFEGLVLQPIYNEQDVQNTACLPGLPGYRRGVHAAGYLENACLNLPYVSESLPEKANAAIQAALSGGADGVRLLLNRETSGAPDAKENAGVVLLNCEDVKTLFSGVALSQLPLHIPLDFSALPVLALFAEAGLPLSQMRGTLAADPLGAFASLGKAPRSLAALYDEMAQSVLFAQKEAPGLRTVLCSGASYASAGADCITELACVLAEASEYMQALTERGVSADVAAASICLSFSVGSDFFMEMAKLRAARVLFASLAKDFGASDGAQKAYISAFTGSFNKTAYDPYVNVLRTSSEAFSALMGSAEELSVLPFDARLGESDAQATRLARNLPLILREEFELSAPIDPAGGSYYVETLTNQVIEAAFASFLALEEAGGLLKALCAGSVQEKIAAVLAAKKAKLNTRAFCMVGINQYANATEETLSRTAFSPFTPTVKPPKTEVCNQLSCLQTAFAAGADLASVAAALRAEDGETCAPLTAHHLSEDFENLRNKTREKGGLRVFLANMGPPSQHKARADFSKGFFEVGGFTVESPQGFDHVQDATLAACESGAAVCVICSTDDSYPELVPALATALKEKAPGMLVMVAGMPAAEHKDRYLAAGVWDFIHIRANCRDILQNILAEGGN